VIFAHLRANWKSRRLRPARDFPVRQPQDGIADFAELVAHEVRHDQPAMSPMLRAIDHKHRMLADHRRHDRVGEGTGFEQIGAIGGEDFFNRFGIANKGDWRGKGRYPNGEIVAVAPRAILEVS